MSAITPEWAEQLEQKLSQLDNKLDQLLDQMRKLSAAGARAQPAPIAHPTFCGYPCSWDIDDAGWPAYIHLEDGTLASHREKQGHHWYSVGLGDGKYGEHYLKFQRAAPPEGLLTLPPPAPSSPEPVPNPAPNPTETPSPQEEASLQHLHTLGRAVHGAKWPQIGPQLVHTHTNGRTNTSSQMQPSEIAALINALQQET